MTTAALACCPPPPPAAGPLLLPATAAFCVPRGDAIEFARLPQTCRREVDLWLGRLSAVSRRMALGESKDAALRAVAAWQGTTHGTLRAKWYAYHGPAGPDWHALLNKARLPHPDREERLPAAFLREVARRYENNQRASKPAWRALIAQWRLWRRTGDERHALPGYTACPEPSDNGRHPAGWSYRNLLTATKLSRFELVAARIGRDAAAPLRPLVFKTRRGLWVGARYQFDDIWHDHFCNCFDARQAGRPLEFHCLDVFSACKIAWGMRLRTRTEEGREKGLTLADFRFLLAFVLGEIGYSPRGTVLVVENGTAAIDKHLAKFLFDASGGLITVVASGMGGDAAHGGQHRGAAKGNPRHKALVESHGSLMHNEFGDIPAQTGKDRDHRPEGLGNLLKANAKLLAAHATLPPERAAMLEWEVMPFRDFQLLAGAVYERLNRRTEHALEGWDDHTAYDPETRLVRRLSPREVFDAGRDELIRLPAPIVAAILGPDLGKPVTVAAGYLKVTDKSLSPDPLRFDPAPLGLAEGAEVVGVLNPLRPGALHVFDAKGGAWLGEAPLVVRPSQADEAACLRQVGKVAAREVELLAPMRERHAPDAAAKAHRERHNARVQDLSRPLTPGEHAAKAERRRLAVPAADFLAPRPEPLTPSRDEKAPAAEDDEGLWLLGSEPATTAGPTYYDAADFISQTHD